LSELQNLYNRIATIYEAEFSGESYDVVNSYGSAKNHPAKHLRLSFWLLQEVHEITNGR
jgi:hypothetical protein